MPLVIVNETRDRQSPVGRKVISYTLGKAMAERKTTSAVYLSKTAAEFAVEIGEWADGSTDSAPFVACVHASLSVAIRSLQVFTNAFAVASGVVIGKQCARTYPRIVGLSHTSHKRTFGPPSSCGSTSGLSLL